jgi:ribosomal protein S27AE
MSIFHTAEATCPNCGTVSEFELVASVNADRRPDLRAAILDRSFQAEACPKCGTQMRLAPHFSYLDLEHGQWILVQPADTIGDWQGEETAARGVYDETFGEAASAPAQALADGLSPRLVFGWPALREKLICSDLALDDVTLELTKIAIVRNVADSPMADQTELRLTGGENGSLHFSWLVTETEESVTGLDVPREVYDGVAGDLESWAALREQFEGQMFVDFKRLLVG